MVDTKAAMITQDEALTEIVSAMQGWNDEAYQTSGPHTLYTVSKILRLAGYDTFKK